MRVLADLQRIDFVNYFHPAGVPSANQTTSYGVMSSRKQPMHYFASPTQYQCTLSLSLSPRKVLVLNEKEDFGAVTENTGLTEPAVPALIDS